MDKEKIFIIQYNVIKTNNEYDFISIAKDPDGALYDMKTRKSFKTFKKILFNKIKIVKILQFNDMESFESYFNKKYKDNK